MPLPSSLLFKVNAALKAQVDTLWHTTSIYMHAKIHEYAERLTGTDNLWKFPLCFVIMILHTKVQHIWFSLRRMPVCWTNNNTGQYIVDVVINGSTSFSFNTILFNNEIFNRKPQPLTFQPKIHGQNSWLKSSWFMVEMSGDKYCG